VRKVDGGYVPAPIDQLPFVHSRSISCGARWRSDLHFRLPLKRFRLRIFSLFQAFTNSTLRQFDYLYNWSCLPREQWMFV